MSIRIIVNCDGMGCASSIEYEYGYFSMGDLPTIDWSFDQDNEFYYCPSCVKKMIKSGELDD